MESVDTNQLLNQIVEIVTVYGLRVLAAVVILILGRIAASVVAGSVEKVMHARRVDPTLIGFLTGLVRFGILAFTFIAVLGRLGLQTASFVAVLGAAGLAVGLALQGSLSNFAAGVLILLFRPFKIGDFIEAGGSAGKVNEIGILTTVMATPDNKKVILPNSKVMGGTITNFNANGTRRVDLVAGISYSDDIGKAKEILDRILREHPKVLPDPAPVVELFELGDSSVNFVVRPWTAATDYWRVYWDVTRSIKEEFDEADVTIPFPQRDVHLFQESSSV